jgi:hypothetical protein
LKRTPVPVVRRWVGHIDPEIIDHYTHVHDDASQAAMQRLAEANNALQPNTEAPNDQGTGSARNQHNPREEENV